MVARDLDVVEAQEAVVHNLIAKLGPDVADRDAYIHVRTYQVMLWCDLSAYLGAARVC